MNTSHHKKITFFDVKSYDRTAIKPLLPDYPFEVNYLESKLKKVTAILAKGSDAVCAFVNDRFSADTIELLYDLGIKVCALRCAGFNNVDLEAAYGKIHFIRVPNYSPYAVAEHTLALMMTLNRKTHKAYLRTRENNFSIDGFVGFDLHGKKLGIIGTGKIGQTMINLMSGFGMEITAYDIFPKEEIAEKLGFKYVSLEELCSQSDIISLHCPLTPETKHIINEETLSLMKPHAMLLNTGRGGLIKTGPLLNALKRRKIGAAGLDVYEQEGKYFFEDYSTEGISDDSLARLLSFPNVLITSHQAFLTHEALANIASTTLQNLQAYFDGAPLPNEICSKCASGECSKEKTGRCF